MKYLVIIIIVDIYYNNKGETIIDNINNDDVKNEKKMDNNRYNKW